MKPGKKAYVYGAIVAASLALLASQALVGKSDWARRDRETSAATETTDPAVSSTDDGAAGDDASSAANNGTIDDSGDDASANASSGASPEAGPEASSLASDATTSEPNTAATSAAPPAETQASPDPRVARLESSLSALQSLLPADRMQELESIGRAWAVETPVAVEPPASASATNPPPAALPEPSARLEVPAPELGDGSSSSAQGAIAAVPARDPLRAWITANPLTAIAVGPTRGVAAFGGQLYSTGDELPSDLGIVVRIEARSVVLRREGVERRVPLSAFVPRALVPVQAGGAPSGQTPGATIDAPAVVAPAGGSLLEVLKETVKKLSSAPAAGAPPSPPSEDPDAAHHP